MKRKVTIVMLLMLSLLLSACKSECEKNGHNYSEEWTIDVEATETNVGSKSRHCINSGCESKTDITEIPMIRYSEGLQYKLNENNDGYIVESVGECSDAEIRIAPKYNDLPVVEIADYAFYNCELINSIEIPSSVIIIGSHALAGCNNLQKIVIPFVGSKINETKNAYLGYLFGAEGELEYIQNKKFVPKTLKEVKVLGGEFIKAYAFHGCSSLTKIEISSSISKIGEGAFYDCSSLETIILPFVGKELDGYNNTHFAYIFGALYDNYSGDEIPTSLKNVVITGGKRIDDKAFYACQYISNIKLPSSVTSIGERAFESCTNLKEIFISSNVISIGSSAFDLCDSLKIYCEAKAQPKGWDDNWNYSNCPVEWNYKK